MMNQFRLLKALPPSGANMGRRNFNRQSRSVGAVQGAFAYGTHCSVSQFSTDILLLTEHFRWFYFVNQTTSNDQ